MDAHNLLFQEAASEIAKWVHCEQVNNVNLVEFCKTHFKCGTTVVSAPRGMVRRLWVVSDKNFCSPVFYREVDWPEAECFGRAIMGMVGQGSGTAKKLPLGFTEADAGNDSKCGRARAGIWAKYRGNIYIAPWIQSVEMVVIEWDGIKTEYLDDEPVNEDQDYKKALKLYVQYAHERDFGSLERSAIYHSSNPMVKGGLYDEALADLAWQCEERTKRRETPHCPDYRNLLAPAMVELGLAPAAAGPLILAHVGTIGSADSNEEDVATLVAVLGPSNVIVSGVDNNHNSQTYDVGVGQYYHSFLSPYYGAYGAGADKNRFWPGPSEGDWTDDTLDDYLAFFALPGNRRYYDVCLGLVHLFVLDDVETEPDGFTEDSAQGQWLRAKLALSPARWKVVSMSHPPGVGYTAYQWPFKSWGADLVLSGGFPNYERAERAGLLIINNGCGGKALDGTQHFNVSPFTQGFFDSGHHGAGRITVEQKALTYEFISVDNVVRDSVTLSK